MSVINTDTMTASVKKRTGILITLAGGCLWGFSGACGQYLFTYKDACSDWLVPIRLTTAGLLLVLYYLFRRPEDNRRIWTNPGNTVTLILYGILGMMLCQYSYFRAIETSNAGTATVLQYLSPVLIMLVMCIWERRLPSMIHMLSILLALAGIYLLATHGQPGQLVVSGQTLFWGLFSAVTVVLYNLIPRGLMNIYPTPFLLGWAMLIGGISLGLLRRPWQFRPVIDSATVLCLTAVILFGTIAAFSLYMQGVKLIGTGQPLCLHRTGSRYTFFCSLAPYILYRYGFFRFPVHSLYFVPDYVIRKLRKLPYKDCEHFRSKVQMTEYQRKKIRYRLIIII